MAPIPHRIATNFTQPPTCGIVVHKRTITTPTAILPTKGQNSLVRPINHCPTTVPTITCAKYSDAYQTNSVRSEEHTSELQSPMYLVCRLLLEKKNKK